MAELIETETQKDNILFQGKMDYKEWLNLKGNIKNMYLFSEGAFDMKTNLVKRGTKESTMYFLVPRKLRQKLISSNNVKCQKIERDGKIIFCFVINNSKPKT